MGTATKTSKVQSAFNAPATITLESGRDIQIPKWGVKKLMRLGTVIANIIERFFVILRKRKQLSYDDAVADAKQDGLEEGDEGFPTRDQFETAQLNDFFVALPDLMQRCADDLGTLVVEGLTLPNGEQQLTMEEVMGEGENPLTIDEFPEVLAKIIEVNVTEKTVKKWKGLLEALPGMGTK